MFFVRMNVLKLMQCRISWSQRMCLDQKHHYQVPIANKESADSQRILKKENAAS